MKKIKQYQNKLLSHIKEFGIVGSLPQNLSDDLLRIISEEYQASNKDKNTNSGSILVMAVISLLGHETISTNGNGTLSISTEDLLQNIEHYGIWIMTEEIRRSGLIKISENNLPTIKNIFCMKPKIETPENMDEINDFMSHFK